MVNHSCQYDLDRARCIVKRLHDHFKPERTIKKATIELPNNIKWGSKEHFLYIFYGCLLDYGVKSSYYHKRLRSAYLTFPSLFDPEYIIKRFRLDIEELAKMLRNYLGTRFPTEAAKRWLSLSYILYSKYDSDPRNLIKTTQSFNELKERILEIRGFGQKTGGLLIRILYENRLLSSLSDEQNIPFIPIDRHDIYISINLGVIKLLDRHAFKRALISNSCLDVLSKLWVKASILENVDPAETDRNLWLLGSELCASKKCISCPVKDLCSQVSNNGGNNETN